MLRPPRVRFDSAGDAVLFGLCAAAGLLAAVVLAAVAYELITGTRLAYDTFGLGFLGRVDWAPNFGRFGAAVALYGTAVTSALALVIAVPLSGGIALYLALIASPRARALVGGLVEMLAAIPSVILGFWGILVLAPFLKAHVEPALHSVLAFIPIFGSPQTTGLSIFTAGVILSIMVIPIVASLSRDLFLTVPGELTDGAAALGATRWEIIRGVVLPTTAPGVTAAVLLGLGRALGEAIAVTQVIGDASVIHGNVFDTGQSAASRIATDALDIVSPLQRSSLFYLAIVLLAFAMATNFIADQISSRLGVYRRLY